MKKIEIHKNKHLEWFTFSGWFRFKNKLQNDNCNKLFVVKYKKKHLPLKYK